MIGAVMTGGELAIVIAGTRGDWPGGPRTLIPRDPRPCEPDGRTLWFGADLDPDGSRQVWFRITAASPSAGCRREDARTAAADRLVDTLLAWLAPPDRELEPGINRFHVRVSAGRRTPWIERLRGRLPMTGALALAAPPQSSAPRRPPAASPRPPSARTPAGRTPGRSAASTPGSTAWPLEDATLAAYLGELHDHGRVPASAATAVAAACFRARLADDPTPAGKRTARVLAGYRRTAGSRGRGPARPFGAADLAAVLATCRQPRRRGRGRESEDVALERGRLDAVITGLLFMAGMRRSEVSALRWADVDDVAERRRDARRRPPEQDEPGGRDAGRSVREGQRRSSYPDAQGRREPGARGPCRSALAEDGGATVSRRRPAPPASST